MDFNINGITYFSTPNTKITNFKNDKYETDDYILLKKWIIFKLSPSSNDEIKQYEEKINTILKYLIQNFKFNNFKNEEEFLTQIKQKIPESVFRYSSLLNNIIEY
jgi:hypothetical protein